MRAIRTRSIAVPDSFITCYSPGEWIYVVMGVFPADPEETHAAWYGVLDVPGISGISSLTTEEKVNYTKMRHYFRFSVF
jgi:hypothetical protein